ncbi:hypothetical protein P4O66_015884 [Electrophorus voltai]|uniref:MYC binding protein n=1 Tax=Electrophorus voltai TaxID=2609070 RepID=A0AAD9DRC1_9TELE|nr:hypothetical protein P4O66_015884 [Electrophorus voltai]
MAHYRASESKREQFRRYLEKAGVLDSLTNVLVALYEETEKPNNAMEYPLCSIQLDTNGYINPCEVAALKTLSFIKQHLGSGDDSTDIESLRVELSKLQHKYDQLLEENRELKNKLLQYEPATEHRGAE